MSARRDSVGNAEPGSEVEPLHTVGWQGDSFLVFTSAYTLVHNTYVNAFDDAAPVVAGKFTLCQNSVNRSASDLLNV